MELSECISMTKDVMVALAAVLTVFIAYKGLDKWKQELKGKVYFDAARDLIRAVYNFRDQMSYARNPFITIDEFPKDYVHKIKKEAKEEGDKYAYIFNNRLKPLIEVAQDFDVFTLEAEALWGKDIKDKCIRLRKTFFRLKSSFQAHIDDIYSSRENFKNEPEFKKEIRSDMYESRKNDDSLSLEISAAIKDIERIVRPYLDKNL